MMITAVDIHEAHADDVWPYGAEKDAIAEIIFVPNQSGRKKNPKNTTQKAQAHSKDTFLNLKVFLEILILIYEVSTPKSPGCPCVQVEE